VLSDVQIVLILKVKNDDRKGRKIYIHYDGFDNKWDEWIELDSERLAPIGWYTELSLARTLSNGDLEAYNLEPQLTLKLALRSGQPTALLVHQKSNHLLQVNFSNMNELDLASGTLHAIVKTSPPDVGLVFFMWRYNLL